MPTYQEQHLATMPSAIGTAPLDRLRRSAVGLALAAALIASGWSANPAAAQSATPATPAAPESGYVSIDGLELYYERFGGGNATPLLLLHGGLLTSDLAFGPMIPHLAQSRPLITVELEGHGHTALTDRPLSYEQMADDVAFLLQELGLDQVDVVGYSLGGGVAWQLAIRWSEDVATITAPTLVIVGDADSVLPEHTVELFRLLGGGVVGDLGPLPNAQLAVLPGTAHSALLSRTDLLVPFITGFLDAPMALDQ